MSVPMFVSSGINQKFALVVEKQKSKSIKNRNLDIFNDLRLGTIYKSFLAVFCLIIIEFSCNQFKKNA